MTTNECDLHSYNARLVTYADWPFDKDSNCTVQKMAEAGFYHCPSFEPDGVKCYVCSKELDCWDADDEPWEEHKKHSPNCPFLIITNPTDPSVMDVLTLEMARQRILLESKMKLSIAKIQDESKLVHAEIMKKNLDNAC